MEFKEYEISAIIHPRVEFDLKMNQGVLEAIRICCDTHYSPECVRANRPGGFVFGWWNSLNFSIESKFQDHIVYRASWSELDVLLKIIENPPPMIGNEAIAHIRGLQIFLRQCFYSARKAQGEWRQLSIERKYENFGNPRHG